MGASFLKMRYLWNGLSYETEVFTQCSFIEGPSLEHPSPEFLSRVLDIAIWLVLHMFMWNANQNRQAVTPHHRRCCASLPPARNTRAVTAIGMWGYPPVRLTGGTCLCVCLFACPLQVENGWSYRCQTG